MAGSRYRKAAALLAIAIAATALAGCRPAGFDPGMTKRCVMTWTQGAPNSYADQTDCPGDLTTIRNSGQLWGLGANSPGPNGSHCGVQGAPYPIKDNDAVPPNQKSQLHFKMFRPNPSDPRYVAEMAIAKNPCRPKTEITFSMQNGTQVPLAGLVTHHDLRILSQSGIAHVQVRLYLFDGQTGERWGGVSMVLRPISGVDPRWNQPNNPRGVLYRGPTDRPGHHVLVLAGHYYGLPTVCRGANCGFTSITIDWNKVLDDIQRRTNIWRNFWAIRHRMVATVGVDLETFDDGGRIKVQHMNWLSATP